ncbi:hypothetical protein SSX86_002942 [Deinandra increscens subsp. villosa]|uniref:Auxin-responsive protein n=1 Tax=Deinandra increscens subsp. villosa TaxID=3103831 RepID=A0AAP0HA20_9ASTR
MDNSTTDQQESLNMMKRRWLQDHQRRLMSQPYINMLRSPPNNVSPSPPIHRFLKGEDGDDLQLAGVIPAVTVVVEGRSICHRISLLNHDGYNSLARAIRRMLVDDGDCDDMENDLLLAGDLNWKDFTRVARRIRIIPVKGNSSKGKGFK